MWLLAMVLIMLGSSEVIAGLEDHVLPPMARWGWWTLTLWMCGVASIYAPWGRFHWNVMGLLSVSLFYCGYAFLWPTYVQMIPASPDTLPWAEVFVVANVILPLVMVTIGPLRPVARMVGGG